MLNAKSLIESYENVRASYEALRDATRAQWAELTPWPYSDRESILETFRDDIYRLELRLADTAWV